MNDEPIVNIIKTCEIECFIFDVLILEIYLLNDVELESILN